MVGGALLAGIKTPSASGKAGVLPSRRRRTESAAGKLWTSHPGKAGIPAGAKAHERLAAFAARLKSCPDTKQAFAARLKSCPDTRQAFAARLESCPDTRQAFAARPMTRP